jgi:hypothetical protein
MARDAAGHNSSNPLATELFANHLALTSQAIQLARRRLALPKMVIASPLAGS